MDKSHLHKIFSKPFKNSDWLDVLQNVFGAKQLLAQPREILLPSNDKAKAAFELGNFTTTDDRIIGLYRIELNPDVWLERNKVGLRELLRNIYKYDVDGAIIVFDPPDRQTGRGEKWRLSFVSEIKVLNDEGEVIEQATEPKRYTYLLGQDEKVKTPSERLNKLAGKPLALNDILEAFSVEALNEEFYKIVAEYFYQLIGGKIGNGKKGKEYGEGILQLPSVPKENHQVYQEFTVRLIGRIVFCWFLKMKKDNNEKSLLPEKLLSSKAVKNNTNYYHSVLERLFFQTLNTKMSERVDNLPDGCKKIPFLNGGLFEPGTDDYYKANKHTCLSENLNTLKIEDQWFLNFFQELEKYNFTIDENSVTDVEVSVDPEMLGRIFENLLAEIDPDSGETARKATGSFYTPREIVDYMATESLVQYLYTYELKVNYELRIKDDEFKNELRQLFKVDTPIHDLSFITPNTEIIPNLLDALDKVKILDPACGSGAFPMGVLQKIIMVLQKLDSEAEWWKKRQLKRISNPIVKKALREKLDASSVEYAQKIGIIQNSLYGVDIQPIAAEISKLRCFLTLIVDENIDDTKENRGIEPLPNLEFKFVTADTLLKLPEEKDFGGLFNSNDDVDELKELREEYLQSSGIEKEKIKENFIKIQQKIFKKQIVLSENNTESRAYKLSSWNPFNHDKADWFDPRWMYGVEDFDVVIGNPPYLQLSKVPTVSKKYKDYLRTEYLTSGGRLNTFIFFIHKGLRLLNTNGILSYIIPNTILTQEYYSFTRKELLIENTLHQVINYSKMPFANAVVENVTLIVKNQKEGDRYPIRFYEHNLKKMKLITEKYNSDFIDGKSYSLNYNTDKIIESIIKNHSQIVDNLCFVNQAIALKGDKSLSLKDENSEGYYYKLLDGRNINKYQINWTGVYLDYNLERIHSCKRKDIFESNEKLMFRRVSSNLIFTYDNNQLFALNTIVVLNAKNKNVNLKFLLGVLNSSIANYYYKLKHKSTKKVFSEIQARSVKQIPIPICHNSIQEVIKIVVDYILYVNSQEKDPINPHVPNSHLVQLFEEVIDAMVMELYFQEDFKKAGIAFIKYAERDFASIEYLKTEKQKTEVIHQAYQTLRQKDNEIRNNLKLMDIKLADIVMPIKTAK